MIHTDPAYRPDPEEFRPERFAPGAEIPREAYLPFGDGPRICVGNRFAEAEIALVLATLVPRGSPWSRSPSSRCGCPGRRPSAPRAACT